MRGDEGEEINRLYNPPARAPPSGSWMHGMDSWCMTEQGAQDGNSRNRIMKKPELSLTVEKYFEDREESRSIFDVVRAAVTEAGPSEMRVTKSQISFRRRRAFAWVWIPEKYLHRKSAPLVLTLSLTPRDPSPRWKEIVEPYPGRFTHHLELMSPKDVDGEVRGWIRRAWSTAG
jgi:hypothetical protein